MPSIPTREEKMSDAFFVIGSQYYAVAAYCAERMFLPVAVTLFHHAIEMLLKGFLARWKTSAELKRFGHNLEQLWEEFKVTTAEARLANFDTTIVQLNEVELLRYPDSIVDKGFVLNTRLGPPVPMDLPGTEGMRQYLVNVLEINEIATSIFKAGSIPVTPYFKNTPPEMMSTLPVTLRPKI